MNVTYGESLGRDPGDVLTVTVEAAGKMQPHFNVFDSLGLDMTLRLVFWFFFCNGESSARTVY